MALELDDATIIGKKLVRGFMRYHFDLLIPYGHAITIVLHPDEKVAAVQRDFDTLRARFAPGVPGERHHLANEIGAGSLRWEVFATKDPLVGSIWSFNIWDYIPMTASAINEEIAADVAKLTGRATVL